MPRALVFTRTAGYRHDSIEHGVAVLRELLGQDGVEVEHTEDTAAFAAGLADADLVVWLSTSDDVLDDAARAAFADWIRAGGGFAGIHCAAASEQSWPEFEAILGPRFTGHPDPQPGVVVRTDADHPSTAHLPERWAWEDEWYEFAARPGADRTVLLTVDESTYAGGAMGEPHPLAWHGPYGAGHVWFTALGHFPEHYDDAAFRAHLQGGLRSLLGRDAA